MTADEARDRVGEVRSALSRVLRPLSLPEPDWASATVEMGRVADMAARVQMDLWLELMRGREMAGDRETWAEPVCGECAHYHRFGWLYGDWCTRGGGARRVDPCAPACERFERRRDDKR